ncbi:DNA methylase, partial [Candidatus Berkelbacteria bacterium]|nr:DNA methylase [Candidatus Berkelbacteria bacterium]
VIKNDSRRIPLADNTVDMVFIDSPYGDNVNYSNEVADIGKISAEDQNFYDALEKVAREIYRILKPGKVIGWLIGDQWVKRKFTPVGFKIYQMLVDNVKFEPVDLICVTRRNQSSNTGVWHYRAQKFNFFLRGFKYLILVKKPDSKVENLKTTTKVKWQRYK